MTRGGFLLLLVLAAMNGAAFGALMYYKRRARQLVVDLRMREAPCARAQAPRYAAQRGRIMIGCKAGRARACMLARALAPGLALRESPER